MITETYRGRKLKARKGSDWGTVLVTCNGELAWSATDRDLQRALGNAKALIDSVDAEPVNGDRWGAHWYAPGTYEMCPEGIHPQEVGGQCQHFTCVARRQAQPCGLDECDCADYAN